MHDNDELVTVATVGSLPELDLARGLLESEGIDCLAPEEHLAATKGALYGLSVGWMRLQVRGSDADRAKALLESFNGQQLESQKDED